MSPPDIAPQSQPKWHLLYYALAAFDILTVLASVYLGIQIMNVYSRSVEINQEWARRLEAYADLGRLAQAVNAPGNDVFDTQDTSAEATKMRTARTAFATRMGDLRRELEHLEQSSAATITQHLDAVQTAMTAMISEEELIFSYFSQQRSQEAGQRMATMDRKYAAVNDALAYLRTHVAAMQDANFIDQMATARQLQKFEYLVAFGVLFMVSAALLYGHHISVRITQTTQEREQTLTALAEASRILEQQNAELARTRDSALEAAWIKTGQTELSDRMRGKQDLRELGQNALSYMAAYVNALVGVLYLPTEDGRLSLTSSYAYAKRKSHHESFAFGEGLIGQAAVSQKPLLLHDVAQEHFSISSALGETAPRGLAVLPLVYRDITEGVIVLGTLHALPTTHCTFLTQAAADVASVFSTTRAQLQAQTLRQTTQAQAVEFQPQQE